MKKLLLATLLLAFISPTEAANKKVTMNIPLPRPIPVEKIYVADKGDLFAKPTFIAQNPDPFKTQPGSQVQVPNPPTGSPININVPPINMPHTDNFIQYLWMVLAGLLGTLFGIPQLKNAFGGQKLDLKSLIQSPDFHRVIDQAILDAVDSGLPGQIVKQIPGIGIFEPLIHQAVEGILKKKLAEGAIGGAAPAPAMPADFFDKLKDIIDSRLGGHK